LVLIDRYRNYYTEEIVLVLLFLSVLFVIFSLRRWREVKREITERTRSERSQLETERRSQALLTTIPNITFRIRRDGTYLDFRAGSPGDLFTSTDTLVGSTVHQRLPKEVADRYMEHIERALNSNAIQTFTYQLPIKSVQKKFEARIIASGTDEVFVLIRNVTDAAEISDALAESEIRFRTVVESLNEGLILTDLNDNIIYINRRMTDLCGWATEELISRPANSFFIPPEHSAAHKERNKRRGEGIAERYEMEMLRKDGTKFWAEIYGSPYRDMNGNISGSIGIITDISDVKWNQRLQSALYRIRSVNLVANDMQQMFAQLHEIIGELMYAKNFYIALYDPVTAMISFPYFVDEYDPAPAPRPFLHGSTEYILTTGKILHAPEQVFEEMSHHGDVELIGAQAVDWLGIPLNFEGKPFGVLAIQSYDPKITYSEREKEILVFVSDHISSVIRQRWEEERFRTVWEGSTEGMRVTDKDGNIVMVNEAYCTLVKKKKEELLGYSFHYAYLNKDEDISPAIAVYKERFMNNTIPEWVETQISLWNKTTIAIEMTTSYITLGNNERMLLSIFRDVTERKKLEDQLLHAQKMDSIGVLAGGIAHDFNNVLAMILGSAELIKHKAKEQPEIMKFAHMIANAAERGSGIAKQLLMFARAEKGMLRPLSLSAVVQDVSKLLEHSIPKSIAITTRTLTEYDAILGDEDQLHQVIINLSVNARDAILHKGGSGGTLSFEIDTVHGRELRTKFSRISDDDFVVLRVIDDGSGMNEETVQHIFEPFYTTKERGKGTGLGLSIVHGIVKNHNGMIDVESVVDKGTTFTLYFPLTHIVDRRSSESVITAATTVVLPAAPSTILVVDDESELRMMLKDILESDGFTILTASNGNEAKELFAENAAAISLIVSDLGMPVCDGLQLYRHIRSMSPTIPFVMSTGYSNRESRDELDASGVDGILMKPFKVEQILEMVHRFTRPR
jgi:PAS domain S-box-containing protein